MDYIKHMILNQELIIDFEEYYFSSAHSLWLWSSALGSTYFSTAPIPDYFYAVPMYQTYYLTALLVENISCISVLSKSQTFQIKVR